MIFLLLVGSFVALILWNFFIKKTSSKVLPGCSNSHNIATVLSEKNDTFGRLFRARVEETPKSIAFYEKVDGKWHETTWETTYKRCVSFAYSVISRHNISAGDNVCILGPTRSAWGELDLGSHCAAIVPIGLFPNQSIDQYRHIIDHSNSKLVFVSGENELLKIIEAVKKNKKVQAIIPWEENLYNKYSSLNPRLESFQSYFSLTLTEAQMLVVQKQIDLVQKEDTATIIYTSGTTGQSKGCVLTHYGIISLLNIFADYSREIGTEVRRDDTVLSFLPMAFVAERVIGFYFRLSTGMPAIYATDPSHVINELRETNPTRFGCVPRVLEKTYYVAKNYYAKFGIIGNQVFKWSENVAQQIVHLSQSELHIPFSLKIKYFLIDFLVFQHIRKTFGSRIRSIFVGAAPTPVHILIFFFAARVPLFEIYGATELSGATHANYGFRRKFNHIGSQGRPGPRVIQRIDSRTGELLIKGPMLFLGYYKDPIATSDSFSEDGYFRTGDIATIDEQGFITIIDRLSNMIKTSSGKSIASQRIEKAVLKQTSLIAHVFVHGDCRKYITAIISVDSSQVLKLGEKFGLISHEDYLDLQKQLLQSPFARTALVETHVRAICSHGKLREMLVDAIKQANHKLADFEQIKRILLLDRELSQEHGEITPSLKIIRKTIEDKYQSALDALYDDNFFGTGSAVAKCDRAGFERFQYIIIETKYDS